MGNTPCKVPTGYIYFASVDCRSSVRISRSIARWQPNVRFVKILINNMSAWITVYCQDYDMVIKAYQLAHDAVTLCVPIQTIRSNYHGLYSFWSAFFRYSYYTLPRLGHWDEHIAILMKLRLLYLWIPFAQTTMHFYSFVNQFQASRFPSQGIVHVEFQWIMNLKEASEIKMEMGYPMALSEWM